MNSGRRLSPWCAAGVALLGLALPLLATPARADSGWLEAAFRKEPAPAPKAEVKPKAGVARRVLARRNADPNAGKWPGVASALLPFVGQRIASPGKGPDPWVIRRAAWTEEDESGFEAFVAAIGNSDCASVHDCMSNAAANPRFHDKHPTGLTFAADCADLPYLLRAYFAWMSGLPFSHSTVVTQRTGTGGERLPGNQVIGRMDIVGPGPDPRHALARMTRLVSSEHFRVPPSQTGALLPDHYPVRITRDSIRPGTLIFDPDGHVAVVYRVTPDGLIHYIDAHPDNTITRGIYGREFTRAAPEMGAGFRRWRPQVLRGASAAADGSLVGGTITLAADAELPDWSDEQYLGTGERKPDALARQRPVDWSKSTFAIAGEVLDYYDFVRVRLAGPGFKYDPIEETRTLVRSLCQDLRYRVIAIDAAVRAGMHLRPQPSRLPNNIYATDGDWELYATPSRDARLKTSFEELRDEVERFLKLEQKRSRRLTYSGIDLRADLAQVYRREAADCRISYVRSNGESQTLGFEEVRHRLFRLSFDPYHCVERRWGADDAGELRSCPDGPDKRAWYEAEDRLRNQLTRTYGERMGWTLAELQRRDIAIGMDEAPDIDVPKLLETWGTPKATARAGKDGKRR